MYNVTLLEAVPARTRWPFPRVLEETYPRFRSFRLFVIYFVGLFEDLKVFRKFFFFFFFLSCLEMFDDWVLFSLDFPRYREREREMLGRCNFTMFTREGLR